MRYLPACFIPLLIAVLLQLPARAQKQFTNQIEWKVGAALPPTAPGAKQLGVAGAAAGVHNNALILAGGANFPDSMPWTGARKKYYDEVFVFTKNAQGGIQPVAKPFHLPYAVGYGAACTTPLGVLLAGGENETGPLDKVVLLKWSEAKVELGVQDLPSLPFAVANAAIACRDAVVYLAGGESASGTSSVFLTLDLNNLSAGWKTLPSLVQPVSHAVMALQSDGDHPALFLIGGRSKNEKGVSNFQADVFEFDLKEGKWAERQPLPYPLSAATGLPMGASYILVFSGDQGGAFRPVDSLNAVMNAEQNPARKVQFAAQKKELQMAHPGFSRDILLYNTITNVWTVAGNLPFEGQVTTTAVHWGEDIIIPSGEVKAGVRTPNIMQGVISKKQFFSWIDVAVLIVCFLLMTVARHFFTSHKTTASDYFKGGQRIPQWAAGISIFGAKLSAITFMGVPAKAYASNWTYFFLLMTIIMIMPVVVRFFIPFYRRLNVTSAYEYLDKRFNYGTRVLASLLYILLQLGRMGIVVLLPSIALTLVTGIDVNLCILMIGAISIFFTVRGGIEAVIWVEVVQVLLLAGGALLCLFYIPFQLDDFSGGIEAIKNYDKLKVFDFRFNFSEPTLWVVIIGGLALNLITYGTDQTTVQRYLTTKTEKESVKSLKVGAWLALPSSFVFFAIGTLLFLFFREQPEQVNFSLNNIDNIFPWYIVSQLPAGLSGLLIAGIFAAAMSSTEASMNSVATLLTTDFYRKWKPEVTEGQTLKFARISTLLLGLFVTGIALYMAHKGVGSLWDKFNTILGLFTGCIGGVFLLGIFTKRATGRGVVAGILASCVSQLLVQSFTSIHLLLYAFTGVVSCMFFGYVFSLLSGGQTKDIKGLTIYDLHAQKNA